MAISGLTGVTTSVAETGTKVEADATLLRRALNIEGATATSIIDSVTPVAPTATNLPEHLGKNINTTA